MPHIESKDGTRIAYDHVGEGAVVIMVDGALAHRAFRGGGALAAELAGDFLVVTYDRRGRGESGDRAPYAVEREIEDLGAMIDALGGRAALYGFSSGAVLALKGAAALPGKVTALVLHEPPFNTNDEQTKREVAEYAERMAKLLADGRKADALGLFLQDMVPPDVLSGLRETPEWTVMEAVAPTLAYDNAVLGDGTVPVDAARRITVPVLVLDGGDSADFKHVAADELARVLPKVERRTLQGHDTMVPAEVVAPVLREFFRCG